MNYPDPAATHIDFFNIHGYLVVENAIPAAQLDELERYCDHILADKEKLAFDWAWANEETKEQRSFRIVQSSPSFVWKDIKQAPYRKWLVEFASVLMNQKLEFWYDQFLGKPPGKSLPTYWHQDEGYWGRNLTDKGATCWIPLQDVDVENGCMHFIDGGHQDGVLTHRGVEGVQSDLLRCDPDELRSIACPIKRGSVTFHHSKTPHMTPANVSQRWRKAVSNHMQAIGAGGEGDHYPWKVYVNQRTGERIVPKSSADGVPRELIEGRKKV